MPKEAHVSAVHSSLSILESHGFPGSSTVEIVGALKPWRRRFSPQKNELIPVYLQGQFPDPTYRARTPLPSAIKPGYLELGETKRGYPFAPLYPKQTISPRSILLEDGTIGVEASTDRDFYTGVRYFGFVATKFSFVESDQDFAARDSLGVWDHTREPLEKLSEEALDMGAQKLADQIGSLGLIGTQPLAV